MKPLSNPLFFIILLLTLCSDLCTAAIFGSQVTYLSVAFYIYLLFGAAAGWRLTLTALTISLESLFFYGTFGLDLVYLLPATLIGLQMRTMFYGRTASRFLLLGGCIIAQNLLINGYLLHALTPAAYTAKKICATMMLMLLFP